MEFLTVILGLALVVLLVACKFMNDQLRWTQRKLEDDRYLLDIAQAQTRQMISKYRRLLRDWNNLVDRVNAIGGERALSGNVNTLNMSEDDIKRLLQLCHPDRHRNSDLSVEMTQKLLQLRDQVRSS